MFYPVQKGAIEALKQERKWFDDLNLIYAKRKKIVIQICKKLNLKFIPKKAYFSYFVVSNFFTILISK